MLVKAIVISEITLGHWKELQDRPVLIQECEAY